MRCSLNLHLRSAHEKPQQPNRFDSPTDPVEGHCLGSEGLKKDTKVHKKDTEGHKGDTEGHHLKQRS